MACFHADLQVLFLMYLKKDFFGPEAWGRKVSNNRAREPRFVTLLLSQGYDKPGVRFLKG